MSEKAKNIYLVVFVGIVFFGLAIFAILKAPDDFSDVERRKLEQFPDISIKTLLNGRFMEDFEDYTLDQFPLRDGFRSAKAFTSLKVMCQLDSKGLYIHNGSIAAMEYPIDTSSINWAAASFNKVYETYLKDAENVSFAIVPDKNCYLAEDAGRLSLDYDKMFRLVQEATPFASHIDIRDMLSIDDYYLTDTHWRQEKIIDVAQAIAEDLGTAIPDKYDTVKIEAPFRGVYYSQLGLKVDTEDAYYLTNDIIESFHVRDMENSKDIPVYNMALAEGKDPYELFLSGPLSLVTIENPSVNTQKELVIFRDSFGSAIAPLLAQAYSKVTVVDIRYMQPAMLGHFVDFTNCDALFLYSTLVLNNSSTIKQ